MNLDDENSTGHLIFESQNDENSPVIIPSHPDVYFIYIISAALTLRLEAGR